MYLVAFCGYIIFVPILLYVLIHLLPWQIGGVPKYIDRKQAVDLALVRVFVLNRWYVIVFAVFWLPMLIIGLVVSVFFSSYFMDELKRNM